MKNNCILQDKYSQLTKVTYLGSDSNWLKGNEELDITYYKDKFHLIEEEYQKLVNSISEILSLKKSADCLLFKNTIRSKPNIRIKNTLYLTLPPMKNFTKNSSFKAVTPTISHIFSETNPPLPIINVVCKYLRQFLGTSFGFATLPTWCNIE